MKEFSEARLKSRKSPYTSVELTPYAPAWTKQWTNEWTSKQNSLTNGALVDNTTD